MSTHDFSPRDPLAGQRVAQALAVSVQLDRALLVNAADLFDGGARDADAAQRLCRQVGDTLRTITSMLPP